MSDYLARAQKSVHIQNLLNGVLLSTGYEFDEDDDYYNSAVEAFLSNDWDTKPVADRLVMIHEEGGGEGGTEHVEAVFMLDEKLYKATWRYFSHHGYDFDNLEFFEVTPVEKTITVYEEI